MVRGEVLTLELEMQAVRRTLMEDGKREGQRLKETKQGNKKKERERERCSRGHGV